MPLLHSDTFEFTLSFDSRCAWLSLSLFIFLFATFFLWKIMQVMGGMIREKDEKGISKNMKRKPVREQNGDIIKDSQPTDITVAIQEGKCIALIPLTIKYDSIKFKAILDSMPPASINLLKKWLRLDFLFMFFLYPAMIFLSNWLVHCSLVRNEKIWCPFVAWCGWLALVTWVLDILENYFALQTIDNAVVDPGFCEIEKKLNVIPMRLSSALKWCTAIVYAIPVFSMVLINLTLWIISHWRQWI